MTYRRQALRIAICCAIGHRIRPAPPFWLGRRHCTRCRIML